MGTSGRGCTSMELKIPADPWSPAEITGTRAVPSIEDAPLHNRGVWRVISPGWHSTSPVQGGRRLWKLCVSPGWLWDQRTGRGQAQPGHGGLLSSDSLPWRWDAAIPQGIRDTKISLGAVSLPSEPRQDQGQRHKPQTGSCTLGKESIRDRFWSAARGYPSTDPAGTGGENPLGMRLIPKIPCDSLNRQQQGGEGPPGDSTALISSCPELCLSPKAYGELAAPLSPRCHSLELQEWE